MPALAAQTSVAWNGHEGPLVTRAKNYDIVACTLCGFRHVVPLPNPAQMMREYRDTYYVNEKPTFLTHAGEDQDWAELAQRDRLEIFERLVPRERRRLLDIGSGPGFFLRTAKERGWRVLGIEPSKQAAKHAREMGIEVVEGFFDADTAEGLGRFDVVHLNNVLEHVANPIELIAVARDLLADSGVLCINVPNDFTAFQEAARTARGIKQWWVAPPHHLNYFDFDSLSRLVERLGFAVREKTTSFPMEMFLLMGLDYTADPKLGRACHGQRKTFDLGLETAGFKETRRTFYRALAEAGIGREAVVIAVKK